MAFLEGQTAIRYPVGTFDPCTGNACFNDVLPIVSSDGVPRGEIPFPPLPAVLLLPFVALWGRATDSQLVFGILAAVDVGLCWWMLGKLPIRRVVRAAATAFFAFGTVFWYSAQLATTWYQAHILAVALLLLSVGVALGADRDAAIDEDDLPHPDDADLVAAGGGRGCRGPRAGRWARPARPRSPPGPRRPPVRAGLHEPAHDRVRRSVLPARRRRRLVAASGAVGGGRGGDPDRGAAALQPGLDRAADPARLPVPLRARGELLHEPRLPPRLVDRGPPLHPAKSLDHAVQHAGDPAGRLSRPASATARSCAPSRARSAACSTPTAPSRCPATPG